MNFREFTGRFYRLHRETQPDENDPRSLIVGAPAQATVDPAAIEQSLDLNRAARRQIQRDLQSAGFAPGAPDGLFGPVTRAAIRQWQATRGLAVTGYVDAVALAALQAGLEKAPRGAPRQAEADSRAPRQAEVDPDALRQAELRATLRRLAQALGVGGGLNIGATDDGRPTEPLAEAPRRVALAGRSPAGQPQAPPQPQHDRLFGALAGALEPRRRRCFWFRAEPKERGSSPGACSRALRHDHARWSRGLFHNNRF